MNRHLLIWVLLTIVSQSLQAARPTVHAANFKASLITCNSLQLNWTYGDGSARIIVAREGAAPNWTPSDYTEYTPNANFGKGTDQNGSGNYVIYNANGTNFVRVDSLKTGRTYYFTIYEHDNAAANTLYYTSNGPPQENATTYVINLKFNIDEIDSCEEHNAFKFYNKSNSTVPGITYNFYFGDATNATCAENDSILHSYKNKYGQVSVRLNASPNLGCLADFTRYVRIYPKRVAYIDYSSFQDTVCLGTKFLIDPQPIITPLPKSFTYEWNYGDGSLSSTFKKMDYTYKTAGSFKVEVEITTKVNLIATSCKDTLRIDLVVLPSPVGSASVNDTFQCITYNKFIFTNTDNSLSYYKWYYGNNDSSSQQTFSYSYSKVGTDTIIHVAYSLAGCKGKDTVIVEVLNDLNSDFNGLNAQYCTSNAPIILNPVVPGGVFEGFYLPDPQNSFIPSQVGKFKMSYILTSPYCKDTTTKDFEIFQTPVPNLGADVAICNGASHILDANYVPGTYLWNTNETTQKISVSNTGTYSVEVTDGICKATDDVKVVYSTIPIIELGLDTSVCKGNKLILKVSNPKSTYLWQDGSTDSIYTVYDPGKYKVVVTNPCGTIQDSIYVFFQNDYCDLFMANAFSPDNDLINSVFKPVGKNITVELFQIYNRWGQLVFETDKDDVGWNGTFMGKDSPMELYIWKLFYTTPSGKYIKKNNASGTVLLIR